MNIRQYNDNITRGRYEVNSFQLHRLFSEANSYLIDYILDKSYVNNNDSRVRRIYAEHDAVTYYMIVLDAIARIRGEDKFDSENGKSLVKLKLHDKEAKFLCNFSDKLRNECELMKNRIANFPMRVISDDIIDPAVSKKSGESVDYSITNGYSYAKLRIPEYCGIGGSIRSIRGLCFNIADRACEVLRNRRNVGLETIRLIDNFKTNFANNIAAAFAAKAKYIGGGNWNIEKARGNVTMITITAHTKRSPDDEHDPAVAAKELVKSLNRSLNRLERIVRTVAAEVLDRYQHIYHISKIATSAKQIRQLCLDRGLITPDRCTLEAVDELLRTTKKIGTSLENFLV